jgi:hypothetical protein
MESEGVEESSNELTSWHGRGAADSDRDLDALRGHSSYSITCSTQGVEGVIQQRQQCVKDQRSWQKL